MARIYEAVILNNGGRNGEVYSVDKSFFYRVVSPTSHVKEATNPEELFAASYSACFNGALELVLSKRGLMNKSIVTAKVSLNENEKENYSISVVLEILIEGLSEELAMELITEADLVCPYSKAIKGNVDKEIKLVNK
ncbi:peroxiredoxin, Ohr subfamily [Enterococcus hirae]|uniref:Ohr family peroxiredoxin n=1 Tax=Enterococcus hirae TaxID=1354 RepID=UPI001027B2BB|nr:Ohr family peroxiredoxin [Enterococcus hirae]MDQ2183103.1 Ohr family peroxiredoxin [Enterococcus hirae]VFA55614.1 peroxiredoxin, Ohr subfamily [Enterococcus hirae]VTS69255.1 peroxiredoxin, Ohr subfamily [Enterococcus hirae]VTS75887.1 peroxiredoxin, Ohr subfamily [Enterococcus hirae]